MLVCILRALHLENFGLDLDETVYALDGSGWQEGKVY